MQSIENETCEEILKIKRGELLFPNDFNALGSSEAIRLALHRLKKEKQITRDIDLRYYTCFMVSF